MGFIAVGPYGGFVGVAGEDGFNAGSGVDDVEECALPKAVIVDPVADSDPRAVDEDDRGDERVGGELSGEPVALGLAEGVILAGVEGDEAP